MMLSQHTPTARFAALALDAIKLSTSYRVAIQVHTLGREHVELHRFGFDDLVRELSRGYS